MPAHRLPLVVSALLLGLLAGCGDNESPSQNGTPNEPPVTRTWTGPYQTDTGSGTILFELVQRGEEVTGQVVLKPRSSESGFPLWVRGSLVAGRVLLELDTGVVSYQYTFSVDARTSIEGGLNGGFVFSPTNLVATFDAHPVEWGHVDVVLSRELQFDLLTMAFDGTDLWLSSIGDDYIVMNTAAEPLRKVTVFYRPGTHWTGTTLASNGVHFWGDLPLTVGHPDGSTTDESLILEFDKNGTIVGDFTLPHRTSGLAFDGTNIWSLRVGYSRLYEVTTAGAVLDSVDLDLPDPYQLAYDGQYFWTTGWYLQRLYKIDRTGATVRVYDPPGGGNVDFPAGIAFDGAHMWLGTASWLATGFVSTLHELSTN